MAAGDTERSDIAGSKITFERAYRDHFPRVRSFLRVCLRSTAVADDLAQDTFLQFWRRPEAFDSERGSLRAYLLGIARKKAADWWRHSQSQIDESPDRNRASSDNTLTIQDALAQLDTDLRNILWLREAEGYSYDELAQILEIPIGTVRSRLFSAREQLRQIWKSK